MPYQLNDPNLPFEVRKAQLQERRRHAMQIAEEARASLGPMNQGQMVSGHYVARSPWAQAADAFSLGYGEYQREKSLRDEVALAAQEQEEGLEYLKNRPQSRVAEEQSGGMTEDEPLQVTRTTVAPTRDEMLDYAGKGMLKYPSLRGTLTKLYEDQLIQEPVRQEARTERVEEKAASRLAKREELQAKHEADFKALQEKLADRSLDRESRERTAQQARDLQWLIASGNQDLRRLQIQAAADRAEDKRDTARNAAENKPLSVADLTKLQGRSALVDTTDKFVQDFKDSYSGLTGEASRATGTYSPIATQNSRDTATFWNNYQAHKNQVRHGLFGSALTSYERAEWDKADITPTMEAGQIRKNLAQRADLERKAYEKLEGAVRAGGRQEQLDAIRPSSAPVKISNDAEWAKLKPGTKFIGPDGKERTK